MDIGQNTTGSNSDAAKQLAQLLVVAHSQLNVAWHNAGLLVVTSCVACQLKDLGCKIFQDSCLQITQNRQTAHPASELGINDN